MSRSLFTMPLILVNVFLLLSYNACGQNYNVSWGKEAKLKNGEVISKVLGHDNQHFFTLRQNTRKGLFWLEQYAMQNMGKVGEQPLQLTDNMGRETELEDILFIEENIILFTTRTSRRENTIEAYGQVLSKKGIPLSEPKLLETIPYQNARRSKDAKFFFIPSKDSSQIFVYGLCRAEEEERSVFGYKLFDPQLQLIRAEKVRLPHANFQPRISDFLVDESGNIYTLLRIKAASEKKGFLRPENPATKKYAIISIDPNQNIIKEYDIQLKDKWVISVVFDFTPDGDLAVGGFYSNDASLSFAGTFYMTIDRSTKEIRTKGFKAFDRKFLLEFMSERQVDKGKELDSFYFDHFLIGEDGNALLVAEQYYVSVTTTTDPNTGLINQTYNYHYNDLIVVKVNPDAQIDWSVRVPKRQVSSNDNGPFSSYALAYEDNTLRLIYNDHAKNLLPDGSEGERSSNPRTMSNARKSITVLTEITENGQTKTQPLLKAKDMSTILKPKLYEHLQDKTLLIYAEKGRLYRFGKLIFP